MFGQLIRIILLILRRKGTDQKGHEEGLKICIQNLGLRFVYVNQRFYKLFGLVDTEQWTIFMNTILSHKFNPVYQTLCFNPHTPTATHSHLKFGRKNAFRFTSLSQIYKTPLLFNLL